MILCDDAILCKVIPPSRSRGYSHGEQDSCLVEKMVGPSTPYASWAPNPFLEGHIVISSLCKYFFSHAKFFSVSPQLYCASRLVDAVV